MDRVKLAKLLVETIYHYGENNQKMKAIEELSELIKAICKNDIENIREEIADVYVMLEQLEIIYTFPHDSIERIKEEKIKRTIEQIERSKKNE